MYAIYMVTFTINIPQMLASIAYMDPMGNNQPKHSPRTGGLTYSICYELDVFRQHAPAIVKWHTWVPSTYMKIWGTRWCPPS